MDVTKIPEAQRLKAKAVFEDATTLGTTAVVLCVQLFDVDCLEWEPQLLEDAISTHIKADINADVMQRFQAAATVLLQPDQFFQSPETFHIVCASLLDPDSTPEQMAAAPSPVELAWSCAEAKALLGEDYSNSRFSPQVARYCGAALMYEGLYKAPPILGFADFPRERYPTHMADDEILAMTVAQEQQVHLEDVESSLQILKKLYTQQLQALAEFGGDKDAFAKLKL